MAVFEMWVCSTVVEALNSYQTFLVVSPIESSERYVQGCLSHEILGVDVSSQGNQKVDDFVRVAVTSPV